VHRTRLLACLAALALALGACSPDDATDPGATSAAPAPGDTPAAAAPQLTPPGTAEVPADIRETETAITAAINDQRREHGLEPLEHQDDLAVVARDFSAQMIEQDFFDHIDPAGESVADRVRAAGITFTVVGENLYGASGPVGMVDHVERSVSGWMESPGHRENILREEFTQTGVGMAWIDDTVRITQVFLRP
jgi:uncharacterized protein YkwD